MDMAAGFFVGFLGSFHCAAMCGPIALVLPQGNTHGFSFYTGRVLYNVGRIVTYAVLGIILGFLGKSIALAGMQRYVSILIGVLLVVAFFLPSVAGKFLIRIFPLSRFATRITSRFAILLHRRSLLSLFLLGVVNGFLPCGFVYVALAGAVTLGEGVRGMAFLAGFGLGTMPVMLAISTLGGRISSAFRTRVSALVPVLTLVLAGLFVLRGLNLGIPYISPSLAGEKTEASTCH